MLTLLILVASMSPPLAVATSGSHAAAAPAASALAPARRIAAGDRARNPSPTSAINNAKPAPEGNAQPRASENGSPAWLTILKDIWPTIAAAVAALWVLYLYFFQRLHAPRVELRLEAKYQERSVGAVLILKIKLKNVGKTRVGIAQFGTALRVFVPKGTTEWTHYGSRRIFEEQNAVEPDEELGEDHVTYFSEPAPAVIRVVAEVNSTKRAGWATKAQIPLLEADDD